MLQNGSVGVLPTDTLYGLVASALNPEAVDRVYRLKRRDDGKASIILIGDLKQLDLFGISETDKHRASNYWPGPVSLVLACPDESLKYLHRGSDSLAFRLPANQILWEFLEKSGPLIAPSANLEGHPPAASVDEARDYFAHEIDFYVEGGELEGKPSNLISLLGPEPKTLRG